VKLLWSSAEQQVGSGVGRVGRQIEFCGYLLDFLFIYIILISLLRVIYYHYF
jgi:hypothetical protein